MLLEMLNRFTFCENFRNGRENIFNKKIMLSPNLARTEI